MDIQTITSMIGSLGFPIVACVALFTQMNKNNEMHKQEMNELKDAVNNNTIVLQKLVDRLGDDKA